MKNGEADDPEQAFMDSKGTEHRFALNDREVDEELKKTDPNNFIEDDQFKNDDDAAEEEDDVSEAEKRDEVPTMMTPNE